MEFTRRTATLMRKELRLYKGKSGLGGGGGSGGGKSPILDGEPETYETFFDKQLPAYLGGGYKDSILDASFNADTGELKLDWAKDKEYTSSNRKRDYIDVTVQNGMINGRTVNLNLDEQSIKTIDAPSYINDKVKYRLNEAGFRYNSSTTKFEKGYVGYAKSGNTMYIDHAFPPSLSGINVVKGEGTYEHRTKIKAEGFKWNGKQKQWEK